MYVDFILNGQGNGPVGGALAECRFDPGLLRPYVDNAGKRCVTVNAGTAWDDKAQKYAPRYEKVLVKDLQDQGINLPVWNATSLRKEEWLQLDRQVIRAARARLRAWADLAAANTYGGFNGMAKMVLEHETMSDPGNAVVDMDGLTESTTDSPKFQLEGLPLPIIHSDFSYSLRRLTVSRNSGTPLDTVMGEAAGRRVGELVEKLTIGVETGPIYGGASTQTGGYGRTSQVTGYINFSSRLTKTDLTAPTGSNPESTVTDVLEMRDQLYNNNFFGPFMLYHSTDWDQYLDNDYARLGGNNATMTLRDRLRAIDGVMDVRRLDYLTAANSHAFTLVMVQMTPDVARAVVGMPVQTVQWESMGGMRLNFKVMCIHVPQIRADYSGQCGVLHARTA